MAATLTLVQTCNACPEQYDVLNGEGQEVGYMRLRHGYFAAYAYGAWGPVVYEAQTEGDGAFEDSERGLHLGLGLAAIAARVL